MTLDTKQKKFLMIGGAVILGVYLISKWLKSMPKPQNPDLQATPELDRELVLSKGSKGAEVSELQRILIKDFKADLGKSGANKNGVDGDFGQITEDALFKAKQVKKISLKDL
jgi:peptidoglycan hydrolase-like protein with peptidoglycan-binding domain